MLLHIKSQTASIPILLKSFTDAQCKESVYQSSFSY